MRLLVFGGRRWKRKAAANLVLDTINDMTPIKELIVGTQVTKREGMLIFTDLISYRWATRHKIPTIISKPDYAQHGKEAQRINGRYIMDELQPDMAVKFPHAGGGKRSYYVERHLYLDSIPIITAEEILFPPGLTEQERTRRQYLAEQNARPLRPHRAATMVHRTSIPRPTQIDNPYTQLKKGPLRLTESDRYELWLEHAVACPHCRKWHWPGTPHRSTSPEESKEIDAMLARKHEENKR